MEFILDDKISKEIKAEKFFPGLMERVANNAKRYDMLIVDPAWSFI